MDEARWGVVFPGIAVPVLMLRADLRIVIGHECCRKIFIFFSRNTDCLLKVEQGKKRHFMINTVFFLLSQAG